MAKHKKWQMGSLFKIPQSDGSSSLGQVVAQETEMLNSVTCAFFDTKVTDTVPQIKLEQLIACLFTTHDLLNNGTWPVVGLGEITVPANVYPFEETRSRGWVGAKMFGSGIVMKFLNAYYGLTFWDDWADPNYLDRLLIDPSKKPTSLRYKSDREISNSI